MADDLDEIKEALDELTRQVSDLVSSAQAEAVIVALERIAKALEALVEK